MATLTYLQDEPELEAQRRGRLQEEIPRRRVISLRLREPVQA